MTEQVYLKVNTPLSDEFFLRELEGEEGISELFSYRLRMVSEDNSIDFTQMVGQGLTVLIGLYSGETRYINGIVTRFAQGENDEHLTVYTAEIRPWLWKLTLTADSRIFQNLSAKDIITGVFDEFGFSDYTDSTSGTFNEREYCVQYQETAFDFVSRLMEEEGIFYYFEHEDGVHTLILADDSAQNPPCPAGDTAHYKQVIERWHEEDHVRRCSLEQTVIPNKYATEDYHFETPETDLLTSVDGKESGDLRVYQYPGKFTQTTDGETIANKRIEALELPQKILKGEGYCRSFTAGYAFSLVDHDREDINDTYVLQRVTIKADQERYTNTFEAFPSDVAFRPPLKTRKPRIYGTQTALVVGKSGEEMWTDQYGRIKVQFHWDQVGVQDENSSCWVRVAQVWAGKNWGTWFLPRIGTEVIVSFLEGDPDRPIVVGTVYNATQTIPYGMPGEQNKSTIKTWSTKQGAAGNEIRFDDTKDAEELYVHAQYNMKTEVENDQTITVTKNRTLTLSEGNEEITVTKGTRTIKVDAGDETHNNAANFTQDVKGNYKLIVKGNLDIEVTGNVTIKGAMIKLN